MGVIAVCELSCGLLRNGYWGADYRPRVYPRRNFKSISNPKSLIDAFQRAFSSAKIILTALNARVK